MSVRCGSAWLVGNLERRQRLSGRLITYPSCGFPHTQCVAPDTELSPGPSGWGFSLGGARRPRYLAPRECYASELPQGRLTLVRQGVFSAQRLPD